MATLLPSLICGLIAGKHLVSARSRFRGAISYREIHHRGSNASGSSEFAPSGTVEVVEGDLITFTSSGGRGVFIVVIFYAVIREITAMQRRNVAQAIYNSNTRMGTALGGVGSGRNCNDISLRGRPHGSPGASTNAEASRASAR
jgi:hypothetical protein